MLLQLCARSEAAQAAFAVEQFTSSVVRSAAHEAVELFDPGELAVPIEQVDCTIRIAYQANVQWLWDFAILVGEGEHVKRYAYFLLGGADFADSHRIVERIELVLPEESDVARGTLSVLGKLSRSSKKRVSEGTHSCTLNINNAMLAC
jgi:hypothetical protein